LLTLWDANYPSILKTIADPPALLYCCGRLPNHLALALAVVEAAEKSGSLITAEFALEQGRDVLAVPGGVDRRTSYGPNLLIKQSSHPVTETAEVLQFLGVDSVRGTSAKPLRAAPIHLPGPAGKVLLSLALSPRHSDEIAGESGLTPRELSVILLQLELQGYVEKRPGGCYVLSQPAIAGNRSMENP
jgi:DNA processing protein